MPTHTTGGPAGPVDLHSRIGDAWIAGGGGALESDNPARPGETVARGRTVTAAELDAAVDAAAAAFPGWSACTLHERGGILARAAAIIDARADEWGTELSREEGKTLAEGRGEVARAAQILRYYAGAADRESGTVHPSPRAGEQILVTRRPVGVVAAVTPFNFPIAIPAWKIAPALVYGNTVVWKPAETVPLLALRLMEALVQAGLPAGVLNLVFAAGDLGARLVGHERVDAVTFTGSTAVGREIAAGAARRGVPVQAEMGGKNAAVVLADADVGLAVQQIMAGAFRSSGQKCTATSRLVLDHAVADAVLDGLAREVKSLRVGDPLDPEVHVGPLITAAARERVDRGAAAAVDAGARVVVRGETPGAVGDSAAGNFAPPTVLELDSTDAPVWREELFGPVLAAVRVDGAAAAFSAANDGEYGLSAAVFTRDIGSALGAVDDLSVGVLHINSESAGADPHVPFGGAKASGYGPREQGEAARDFFTTATTVYLRGA
ncbi:aldehyde dehydrogenase family protein [Tomitella fengzijianii]|uniref:Aldehyde dehydrogenase family protein n=1 Tax=Tomitella fengzijianii TaxID=2597660 RepID=A0A516WZJ4_9ACTN|nr:aldehyde dehydrogenase family protein [Tomitella fengzijianii]QDQ96180.1 aldehyde dehydrogenase family protein [Tomitella fengzijianii]